MKPAIEQAAEALRTASPMLYGGSDARRMVDDALARLTAEQARVPPDRQRPGHDAMEAAVTLEIIQSAVGRVTTSKIGSLIEEIVALRFDELRLPADGWRPISTMPKPHQPPILLASRTHIDIGYAENPDEHFEFEHPPTHWMPLPSPPTEETT